MKLVRFSSLDEWVEGSVALIARSGASHSTVAMALSGGATVVPVYKAWRKQNINWKNVRLFQVDERCVPKDHADSNGALIEATLGGSGASITTFDTTLPIEECLADYENQLPQKFALCILGLGPDGHTASLFPHSPALAETKRLVAHTQTEHFAIRDRLTLTFPALMRAEQLLLLLRGKAKEPILEELIYSNKTIEQLPAKKLLKHPKFIIHFYF